MGKNDNHLQENLVLELNQLTYKFPNSNKILFTINNFKINKNDKLLIKGLSGKGKTTLLHIMAGFIKSVGGEVIFLGKNLSSISEEELNKLRRNKISFIFQKLNLISTLTPLENLELVASSHFNKKEAISLLRELGLENQINTVSGQLSTGEQQRVACARAIFSKPEIIFADEPTSSLDDRNTKRVMELLLKKRPLVTLITVSHDHRLEEYFNNIVQFEDIIS